jgi:hypothetical protein
MIHDSITLTSLTTLDRTNSAINAMAQEQITKVEVLFDINLIIDNKIKTFTTIYAAPHPDASGIIDTLLVPFNDLQKVFFKKENNYKETMDAFTQLNKTKYLLPEDTDQG